MAARRCLQAAAGCESAISKEGVAVCEGWPRQPTAWPREHLAWPLSSEWQQPCRWSASPKLPGWTAAEGCTGPRSGDKFLRDLSSPNLR